MASAEHKYRFMGKPFRFMAYFILIFNILKGLFYLGVGFFALFNLTKYNFKPIGVINSMVYFVEYGLLIPFVLIFVVHLFGDLLVDDQGLKVKFLYRVFAIDWDDVLEVKQVVSFGLFKLRNSRIIVTKSKLPFLYKLYGLVYGGAMKPSLFIRSSISDYQNLIEKISKQAKKNHRAEAKSESVAH